MTYMGSTWTFSEDAPFTDREQAVAREQNALKAMETADPEFARAITAKLIPGEERNPDILRQVKP